MKRNITHLFILAVFAFFLKKNIQFARRTEIASASRYQVTFTSVCIKLWVIYLNHATNWMVLTLYQSDFLLLNRNWTNKWFSQNFKTCKWMEHISFDQLLEIFYYFNNSIFNLLLHAKAVRQFLSIFILFFEKFNLFTLKLR